MHIDKKMFTEGEAREIIKSCLEGTTHTGVRMATFLALTQALSTEELCGLNVESIKALKSYPHRRTVQISRVFARQEEMEKNKLVLISDEHKRRQLALPKSIEPLHKKLVGKRGLKEPLLMRGGRRMQPRVLEKEMANFISRTLDMQGDEQKTAALLSTTALRELESHHYEEEELRYQRGKKPHLVSAKSYHDFHNESQLNTLGAMQDIWLGELLPQEGTSSPEKLMMPKRGDVCGWITQEPGRRTQVKVCIPLGVTEGTSKNGFLLEFFANHAFSGKFQYISQDNITMEVNS